MTTSNDQPTTRQITSVARTTTVRVAQLPFQDLCTEVKRFADPKATMPILTTTLLQVEGDKLRVAATDLLLTVDARMPASVTTDSVGSLTDFAAALEASVSSGLCAAPIVSLPPPSVNIDAKKLHEVVKALPGDFIDIVFQEKLALVETDNYRENKTCVCSVCRKRSASANGAYGTRCRRKLSGHAAVCGGKLLETSRDVTRTIEVLLLSGKSRFNMRSLRGVDFPKLPKVDAWLWHRVDAVILREVLDKVAPTISQDTTRSHLNGALLEVFAGLIRGVSTDGHRLTKVDRAVTTTFSTAHCPQRGFVLPLLGVTELLKFLPTLIGKTKKGVIVAPAEVEIALTGDSACHWRKPDGEVVYTQKLEADVRFPPCDQVISRTCERWVKIDRLTLIGALKRVMIVASESGVKLAWTGATAGNDEAPATLKLVAENDDGTAEEQVDASSLGTLSYSAMTWGHRYRELQKTLRDGWEKSDYAKMSPDEAQPFTHGLNGKYLTAALEEMASAPAWVGMNDELTPIVIKSAKDDADVVVIMPMRL